MFLLIILFYLIYPMIFKYTKLCSLFIFLPFIRCESIDFLNPEKIIKNSYNFYLKNIGIWHIVPLGLSKSLKSLKERPIILFLHGIASSRGGYGRTEFYKLFQKLDYNVVCFDYRGFADSQFIIPSKKTVKEDALNVYNFIKKHSEESLVIVCGHSFGTCIALELNKGNGIILLNAFNNMKEIIDAFPLNIWPHFKLHNNLEKFDMNFNPEEKLKDVKVPILFIHSKNDKVIPLKLGVKLFMKSNNSSFEILNKEHLNMYKSKRLPLIITNFLTKISSQRVKLEN